MFKRKKQCNHNWKIVAYHKFYGKYKKECMICNDYQIVNIYAKGVDFAAPFLNVNILKQFDFSIIKIN